MLSGPTISGKASSSALSHLTGVSRAMAGAGDDGRRESSSPWPPEYGPPDNALHSLGMEFTTITAGEVVGRLLVTATCCQVRSPPAAGRPSRPSWLPKNNASTFVLACSRSRCSAAACRRWWRRRRRASAATSRPATGGSPACSCPSTTSGRPTSARPSRRRPSPSSSAVPSRYKNY